MNSSWTASLCVTLLVLAAPFAPQCAADDFKLTPEQMQALEGTRKGFGKGRKLQAEIERMLGQAAETNRVQLALSLAITVAEKWPGEAADAVGKLVQHLPAQAVPLIHAALKAAPKEALEITRAAMSASPTNSVRLATAAIQIAPAQGNAILEAARWRAPKELHPQLEQLKASLPAAVVAPPSRVPRVENPLAR